MGWSYVDLMDMPADVYDVLIEHFPAIAKQMREARV